jgi:hypothetical protein
VWRYATAAGFLLCLVTATQVTAEYKVEVGKRIQLVLPADRMTPEGFGEKVAQAFVSADSHLVDVKALLRRTLDGQATVVVDVWGDRLATDAEGLERLRAMPEIAGVSMEVTSLKGRVRDNLLGFVGHSLFRAGASPEEREPAARGGRGRGHRRGRERGPAEPSPARPRAQAAARAAAAAPVAAAVQAGGPPPDATLQNLSDSMTGSLSQGGRGCTRRARPPATCLTT